MKQLKPVNKNVVLDITDSKAERTTASGIIIPDVTSTEREKDKASIARVKWLGEGIEDCEIEPGDLVAYRTFASSEMQFEGTKYLVIRYVDVLAKVIEE
jgi:chaperonin GroES